jgi:RNA polymerase sigma-70 factor (ECF subfamily)
VTTRQEPLVSRPDAPERRAPAPASPGPPPDAALLARAAEGDRDAFGLLFDRHVRAVHAQAYRTVHDHDLAEDVTQETFVVAWRRVRTIRLVDASVLPWLLVTARQCGLNAVRRERRRRSEELDERTPADDDVARTVELELARAEIDAAVEALGDVDQHLYALCIEGDHTYEQAAERLGVSHAVVRNRLHRLRARLRSDLRAMRETS